MRSYYFILFFLIYSGCSSQVPVREPANSAVLSCIEAVMPFFSHFSSKIKNKKLKTGLEFVNSIDDFYMHMFNHVNNVNKIADEIFTQLQKNPGQWKSVFHIPDHEPIDDELKSLMRSFLQKHDASKINTDPEFLMKINRKKLIIYELYSVYGKSFKDLSQDDKKIIHDLNAIDKGVYDEFMLKNDLPYWKIHFLTQVEKMADGIERGSNPVTEEEMARKPWAESEAILKGINSKMKSNPKSEEIVSLKKKLDFTLMIEKRYKSITIHYSDYKEKIQLLEEALEASNVYNYNLREFHLNYLLNEFEKYKGEILDINDPKWSQEITKFFFEDFNGKMILEKAKYLPQ